MLARASAWASKNPLAAGGIVLAAGGVAYTLYRIASNETFADSDHTVTEEQKAEAERVRSVLDEIGATGVFSVDEAALFSSEFLSSIRSRSRRSVSVDESTGEEVVSHTLDLADCEFIFSRIGVHDRAVAASIFAQWDRSGDGRVDMKEILTVLVLVIRGNHKDKLRMVFDIMDLNSDGTVDKPEMARFLLTVDSLVGAVRSPGERMAAVEAMFAATKTRFLGKLTREEFFALAANTRFHLGKLLTGFLDSLQRKFQTELAASGGAAQVHSLASAAGNRAAPGTLLSPLPVGSVAGMHTSPHFGGAGAGAGAAPVPTLHLSNSAGGAGGKSGPVPLRRTPSEAGADAPEYAEYNAARGAPAAAPAAAGGAVPIDYGKPSIIVTAETE